jgi:hypothetical protein
MLGDRIDIHLQEVLAAYDALRAQLAEVKRERDGLYADGLKYARERNDAQREADASAAGLWMRYVLTGELPVDAPTLGDLYHLDAGDSAMARQIIAAHLATIRAGVVPNLDVCVVLAKWFHAQTDIPADVLARVAEVPS